jgi:hypothetical protein
MLKKKNKLSERRVLKKWSPEFGIGLAATHIWRAYVASRTYIKRPTEDKDAFSNS